MELILQIVSCIVIVVTTISVLLVAANVLDKKVLILAAICAIGGFITQAAMSYMRKESGKLKFFAIANIVLATITIATSMFSIGASGIWDYVLIVSLILVIISAISVFRKPSAMTCAAEKVPLSGLSRNGSIRSNKSSRSEKIGKGFDSAAKVIAMPRMRELSDNLFSCYGVGTGQYGVSCVGLPPSMYQSVFY